MICSQVLLDSSLQRRDIGADHLCDLLAALEEQEGGHGAYAQLGGDLGQLVDVDLVELGGGVLLGELLDLGGDGLAGTAPRGEAVDHDELLAGNCGLIGGLAARGCQFSGSFSALFFPKGGGGVIWGGGGGEQNKLTCQGSRRCRQPL